MKTKYKKAEDLTSDQKTLIREMIYTFLICRDVEFYSGRIMIYTLLEIIGCDPEKVYQITKENKKGLSTNKAFGMIL